MRKYIYVTIRGQTYKVEVDENLDRLLRPILKEKYEKKAVLAILETAYFLIQILVFEILDTRFINQ